MGQVVVRMPHVLVVNQYALPTSASGGTRHIELFGLLSASWTFTIIAADRVYSSDAAIEGNHEHFRFVHILAPKRLGSAGRIMGWSLYCVQAIVIGLCAPNISVVYASSPHLLNGVAGYVVAKLRRKPFVFEVRDLWPAALVDYRFVREGSTLHKVLAWLEGFLYRSADVVVPVAQGWLGYLLSHGVDRERVVAVSNGADPDAFRPRPGVQTIADRLDLSGIVAVYAGAQGPPNGVEFIINAAAEVPQVQFVLYGDGADKAKLAERAERESLLNVHFCDPVPKTELESFLWTADIGIHTMSLADIELYKNGMSPNKLYDYMAAGLPIVTNAGGLAKEIVDSAGCGRATGPDDVAEGVRSLAALPPVERSAMGIAGNEWVRDNASRVVMARRLVTALELAVSVRR